MNVGTALRLIADAATPDPYFSQVRSLVHPSGTDGATTFPDVKGGGWSGTLCEVDADDAPFPGARSVQFNSALGGLRMISGTWGSILGDFTMECWAKSNTATPGTANVAGMEQGGSNFWCWLTSGGNLHFYVGANRISFVGGAAWLADGWCFLTVTRSGTTVTAVIFKADGTRLAGTWTNSPVLDAGNYRPWIGSPANTLAFPGRVAEFRATVGVARDTSARPTAPFPDS